MQSLNDEEIIDIIEEYITSDCEYAILIDGEWGSGKTYFAENKLVEHLSNFNESGTEPKETIYVSLYGVTSKQEIENKITEKILEQSDEKYGKFLARCFKSTKSLSNIINIAIPENVRKQLGEINIEKVIRKFQVVENLILIFDDLERLEMDYNEVFGYINSYVEHNKNKCIIFVNQNEIQKNNIMKNIELKYITVEIMNKLNEVKEENNHQRIIDKEWLKRDVVNLYSEDLSYKKIKEKVIGKEIKYIPNITEVCLKLSNKNVKDKKAKQMLIDNSSIVENRMQREKHCNIRTLKLIIEKFEVIVDILEHSEIKKLEHYDVILKNILLALLYSLVEKKKNDSLKIWREKEHYFLGEIPGFRFIDNFIMTEKLDVEYMIEILIEYNETIKHENEESYSGEIRYLKNNYFLMEDYEINEKLKIIKEKLLANSYKIINYSTILETLLLLEKLELPEFKFEEYFELMKNNIINTPGHQNFSERSYFISDKDIPKYSQYMEELKSLLKEEQKQKRILGMNAIINGENGWGRKLTQYLDLYNIHDNNFFIKEIDIENLLEIFKISDTQDIFEARMAFHDAEIKFEDVEKIETLIKLLDELIKNDTRRTQCLNFKYLRDGLSDKLKMLKNNEQ